ncbi:site-specific integrase [Bacillus sp. Bva_UNVM-123]|uniref:tyrosine-type recombinase/integrase n=1 Tax=Bacillus sp. Bva_UNVM-123 TaxID=2829798 RepID=UPI00391F407C
MLSEKVIKLNNTEVYEQIKKFIDNHSYNSLGTAKAYLADIKLFFSIIKNKEIKYLSHNDIQLTLDDFEDFINYLYNLKSKNQKREYTNKTINRKVTAVKGLVEYLAAKKLISDISYLPLIRFLPEVKNHYGALEAHEVFEMARLASNERNDGDIKSLAILFSLDTCIRKEALLSLKWANFIEKEDVVVVQGIDKGNKHFRESISLEFFEELKRIKTNKSEYVFNISSKSIDRMFARLRDDKMKIPKERNIVFHSIKKAGVNFRYRMTGDILEAQRAAKHSRLDTTRIYLEAEDYGAMGAVSTKGNLDMGLYKKVDKDILIEAIGMCKKDFQTILNLKIKEILKEIKSQ